MEAADHTFIFADLAGFAALTEAHGDEHAADLAVEFYERVRELLEACNGQEVKQLGDAVMLRVDDAADAVTLACRVVEEASGRHGDLDIRVGMHTGPAVARGGDWFGRAVNIAARVAALARGGEVLLTSNTHAAASTALAGRTVECRGDHHFKNIPRPVELWALIVVPKMAAPGLPIDPVCQMAVDPERSVQQLEHRGVVYHFCSETCAEAFAADPAPYVRRQHSNSGE